MKAVVGQSVGHGVAVIIPALNEAQAIGQVVAGVSLYGIAIVVDDGSTDSTGAQAERAGAIVLRHCSNKGYDAALESGLRRAIDLGFEYAVTIDADGQHPPQLLDAFKEALNCGADLVVGTRERHQRFAEFIFAGVSNFLWGVRDPLCGMKGYRLKMLKRFGSYSSYKSVGTELVIRSARSGFSIINIPIFQKERIGLSRFGNGLPANYRIISALLIGLIRAKGVG